MRKKREEVEARYVAEWIYKKYPEFIRIFYQLPIGDFQYKAAKETGLSPRWYWRYGRRADAVVITTESIDIIEAETRRPIIGLSELEVYKQLAPETPHLKPYMNRPIRCILIAPIYNDDVALRAKSIGIEYYLYRPKWIIDHLVRWGVFTGSEEVIE